MAMANRLGAYSMAEIGKHCEVLYMKVSRAVCKYETLRLDTGVLEC